MRLLRRPGTIALLALLSGALVASPATARGQSLTDLLQILSRGGGWVNIPVDDGRGTVDSGTVPTAGMDFEGCVRIWSGHSGTWHVRAEEVVSERVLEESVVPGESVRFRHATRGRARLRVDVRWSEPRDTTLLVWIGLRRQGEDAEAACRPRR